MNIKNPITYEINTRSWIKQFGPASRLKDIPTTYWQNLRSKGVDYVWLMGVWETTKSSIEKYCFHPDLVKAYDRISSDWTKEDIYGSPYAIENYEVSSHLGTNEDLRVIRNILHENEMGLILDFIPNHFNADSALIQQHPEVFLQATQEHFEDDSFTIYPHGDRYFAHGKDPYFPAWTDTVQINYASSAAHSFMTEKLFLLSTLCDGVRCDMAMLVLPEFFAKTWHYLGAQMSPPEAFWKTAIPATKTQNPDFIFIAEAYWDTQWQLQQMGFDYTYDKKLLDLLKMGSAQDTRAHLSGEVTYHEKSVRFIENHDEDRSLMELGESRSRMASVLMSTLPGMKLYYDGQWEGLRVRIPVQMGSSFSEAKCPCTLARACSDLQDGEIPCPCQHKHYMALLEVVKSQVLKEGSWKWLDLGDNPESIFAWEWTHHDAHLIVVINTEAHFHQVKLQLHLRPNDELVDALNKGIGAETTVLNDDGELTVGLPGYKSAIYDVRDQN